MPRNSSLASPNPATLCCHPWNVVPRMTHSNPTVHQGTYLQTYWKAKPILPICHFSVTTGPHQGRPGGLISFSVPSLTAQTLATKHGGTGYATQRTPGPLEFLHPDSDHVASSSLYQANSSLSLVSEAHLQRWLPCSHHSQTHTCLSFYRLFFLTPSFTSQHFIIILSLGHPVSVPRCHSVSSVTTGSVILLHQGI